MLHSRFSQLKLQQNQSQLRTGSDIAGDKIVMPMELVEDETNHTKQPKDSNFLVPDFSTSSTLNSMKKNLERMKHFRSTPTPRPSPKGLDQNETCLKFEAGARKNSSYRSRSTHGSFGNGDVSPLAICRVSMSPHSSREKPPISDELANLCSDSPMSAFKSDSDNSSCLFADESFLSSADFTDDVFGDGNFTLSNSRGTRSYTQHSNWSGHKHHLSATFENYVRENQSVVSKGAAIAGSPSKIRHKNQRVVRRIKSASSFRFSPIKSSPGKAKTLWSGTRWYKAPTDTRLYEVRRRELKEFSQTAADTITLPKRVLQFGECDNKTDQRDSLVEKAKTEIHVELATCRTETPESGYGSLNSTRQTPDLPQVETPVTRFSSRSPFPRAEHHVASSNCVSYKINTCAVPWLEKFDIVSRLFRMASHVVKHVFTYLEPKDLVLFSSVSPQWRLICSSHSPTAKIRDQYLRAQEKAYQIRKENLRLPSRSVRHVTGPGTPLSSVQYLGTPTAASTPTKKTTNFDKFCQLGKQLKEGEKLEQCKCGSPAQIETKTRKASCSSVHCQFEFCVKCKMGYHGSRPCLSSSGARRTRGPSIGSKKSKKNLRRHSRLSAND